VGESERKREAEKLNSTTLVSSSSKYQSCTEEAFLQTVTMNIRVRSCRGTVVRSVWMRGHPVRPRLLRLRHRDRRDRFCVLSNTSLSNVTTKLTTFWRGPSGSGAPSERLV
jgi:hypothetical protein